jgi:hypothetical protein
MSTRRRERRKSLQKSMKLMKFLEMIKRRGSTTVLECPGMNSSRLSKILLVALVLVKEDSQALRASRMHLNKVGRGRGSRLVVTSLKSLKSSLEVARVNKGSEEEDNHLRKEKTSSLMLR